MILNKSNKILANFISRSRLHEDMKHVFKITESKTIKKENVK